MKKILLTNGILAAMVSLAGAQDSDSEIKAVKGSYTVEIQAASPFAGGTSSLFSLNNSSLRIRYFLSDNIALRTNFSLTFDNSSREFNGDSTLSNNNSSSQNGTSTSNSGNANYTLDDIKIKSNSFGFSIMPGIEFHKDVSKRLSAYYGGFVEFSILTSSASVTASGGSYNTNSSSSGTTTSSSSSNGNNFIGTYQENVSGASFGDVSNTSNPKFSANSAGVSTITGIPSSSNNPGYTRFGLYGVLGADYYITKAVYLGVEVNWGFGWQSNANHEVKITDSTVPVSGTTTSNGVTIPSNNPTYTKNYTSDATTNGGSTFIAKPNVITNLRFGFKF